VIDRLYQQIGQLKVELDWLKKSRGLTVEQKRMAITMNHRGIPVSRQCELLGLSRSSLYYRAQADADEETGDAEGREIKTLSTAGAVA